MASYEGTLVLIHCISVNRFTFFPIQINKFQNSDWYVVWTWLVMSLSVFLASAEQWEGCVRLSSQWWWQSSGGFRLCFGGHLRKFNVSSSLPCCRVCGVEPRWAPGGCYKATEFRLRFAQGFCCVCQQSLLLNGNRCTPGKLFPDALTKPVSYSLCVSTSTSRFL